MQEKPFSLSASANVQASFSAAFLNFSTSFLPLPLIDLDNTLIDRARSFKRRLFDSCTGRRAWPSGRDARPTLTTPGTLTRCVESTW
jgi:hypothetical protein